MTKRVVGWRLSKDTTQVCHFCRKNHVTVYVEESLDEYGSEMVGSCDSCTPPNSCEDDIAKCLQRMIEQ